MPLDCRSRVAASWGHCGVSACVDASTGALALRVASDACEIYTGFEEVTAKNRPRSCTTT